MNSDQIEKLADDLLGHLRDKKVKPFSKLTKQFQCELSEIISALKLLENWGYRFKKTKEGVTLVHIPDSLIDSEIKYKLKTKLIGQTLHTYQSVQSTNDIASRLAESGAVEGTVVIADRQTKGRGRLGRKWHSPSDKGAYISIILKPKCKPEQAPGLSIITALSLAKTIEPIVPGKAKIKWPNDILISGKKTAGILTELSTDKNKINYVIVGIGININHITDDFPDELKDISTSLRKAARKKINRVEFLKSFLSSFEKEYLKYDKKISNTALKQIRKYSSLLGSEITLQQGRNKISGIAVDINEHGVLFVESDGMLIEVNSGEVTVIK